MHKTPKRIAIAGFQHETNTFAPGLAGTHEFNVADSWPALLRDHGVIEETRGMNLPISGAITVAEQNNVELIPIIWCAAEPSGPVTTEAFETIVNEIVSAIANAGPLDAVYLDLHGAMVTEQHSDGEAELLRRLRSGPASAVPIGISLDLHANISSQFVQLATVISIYRTYPHLDMADTGSRCMHRLLGALNDQTTYTAFRQAPFLVPLHAQYTGMPPCQQLYAQLQQLADEANDEYLELAMGFTAADIHDCGPAIVASASSPVRAEQLADAMLASFILSESSYETELIDATQAIRQAMIKYNKNPIVIADVQDNAGAGGTSDTTGVLQALITERAKGAVLGVLCDPHTAELAHAVGIGQTIQASLGAKAGLPGHEPINGLWLVQKLSDGNIAYTGEMYGGVTAAIGKSCLLSLQCRDVDIQVVVSSCRSQCLDQALFTHFGIELNKQSIIVVKSTVHFRADFEPIAAQIINVAAPGTFDCNLANVKFQNLRDGLRLGPLGKPFTQGLKSELRKYTQMKQTKQ